MKNIVFLQLERKSLFGLFWGKASSPVSVENKTPEEIGKKKAYITGIVGRINHYTEADVKKRLRFTIKGTPVGADEKDQMLVLLLNGIVYAAAYIPTSKTTDKGEKEKPGKIQREMERSYSATIRDAFSVRFITVRL